MHGCVSGIYYFVQLLAPNDTLRVDCFQTQEVLNIMCRTQCCYIIA